MKVYFAAPWFSPEQAAIHSKVYDVLKASRHIIFSPKHHLEVSPNADAETRRVAFVNNLVQVQQCDFVLGITDYKDVGTIFECGYAFRAGKAVVYYAETLGGGHFNLMLAESGTCIVRDTTELQTILDKLESPSDFRRLRSPYEGGIE